MNPRRCHSDVSSDRPKPPIGRTFRPSVNSTTGCSRLTLQIQDLDARKTSFAGIWGDSGGTRCTVLRVNEVVELEVPLTPQGLPIQSTRLVS